MNKELFQKKTTWTGLAGITTLVIGMAKGAVSLEIGIAGIITNLQLICVRDGMISEDKKSE